MSTTPAPLPPSYEHAKQALAECERIDECKDWADKAAALAAYAKQADDKSLETMAAKIRARAIRRSGELLKELDARGDHRRTDGADSSSPSQREAAEAAGMSERQQVTAVRVANVPEDEFEAAVESDTPPTVSALADKGRKKRPVKVVNAHLRGRTAPQFNRVLHFVAMFERMAKDLEAIEPDEVLPHLLPDELAEWHGYCDRIERNIRFLVTREVNERMRREDEAQAARREKRFTKYGHEGIWHGAPKRIESIDGTPVKSDLPQADVDRILGRKPVDDDDE